MSRKGTFVAVLVALPGVVWGALVAPLVETEEIVYSFIDANNGAGPLWNYGSTNLVRIGEDIYISGLDTLQDEPPLNNTRCRLWRRDVNGWQSFALPESGATREPCPLVAFPTRRELFLSANPTLNSRGTAGRGPAKPAILRFAADDALMSPTLSHPAWRAGAAASFTEHSYRSFAADGARGALILFQNVGNDYAEWTYRNGSGEWSFQGQLKWPWGSDFEPARPVRLAYPNVLLANQTFHFVGVSNILEPVASWRAFKRELTGKSWDYVFRRLFYTWTKDIARPGASTWVELANRDKTAGKITPGDLWVAADGRVHVVWDEMALDMRLRSQFFPHEKQRWELNYAVLHEGKLESRITLLAVDEGDSNPTPRLPRFHITPEGRLFVFFYVNGIDPAGNRISENRIMEINQHGTVGPAIKVPLAKPLNMYMTATSRAGTTPSKFLDLLGVAPAEPNEIRYVRVKVE